MFPVSLQKNQGLSRGSQKSGYFVFSEFFEFFKVKKVILHDYLLINLSKRIWKFVKFNGQAVTSWQEISTQGISVKKSFKRKRHYKEFGNKMDFTRM